MNPLLLDKFFCLSLLFYTLTSCPSFNAGSGGGHCRHYSYNETTKQWTDTLGNPVSCSIADNINIFPYFSEEGCSHWQEFFPTVEFMKVPIRTGTGPLLQIYCVKQGYVEVDSTGQVLLIDKGVFCLKEHAEQEKEYSFSNCAGVYRKNPNAKTATNNTPENKPKPNETAEKS